MQRDGHKIRIGVMGCANIAIRSLLPVLSNHPSFTLVAVSSRTLQKANDVANQFNCEAVVGYDNLVSRPDIDAIYMPLPTGLHEEWVIKCLEAGKHLLVEKSLAMNVDAVHRMLDLAKRMECVIMEDFMFRYHSQHQFVFDQWKSGVIGDLRLFSSSFGFPPLSKDNFRYKKDLGGGALLDAAAYTVNVSRWFLGNELQVQSASLFYDKNEDVCLYGSAALIHPVTGQASQISFGFDNYYKCNYELWGSKGSLVVDRAFTPPPNFSPLVKVNLPGNPQDIRLPIDNHFLNIVSEFGRCILESDFLKHQEDIYHQSRLLTDLETKGHIKYL